MPPSLIASPISPSPAQSPPSLPLPDEILHAIASFSEEKAVWRMMAASQAMRQAVEPALKPFLAERVVSLSPPLSDDHRPSQDDPYLLDPFRDDLHHIHARFNKHMTAYPLSATLVRRLVVEVDDDSIAGWKLVLRTSQQLESLELCAAGEDRRDPRRAPADDDIWRHFYPGPSPWVAPFPPSTRLPNVTRLSITGAPLLRYYMPYILPLAPRLRDLTITSYGATLGSRLELPLMPDLERLAMSGRGSVLASFGDAIRTNAPGLRYLSVSVERDDPEHLDVRISAFSSKCSQLEGVALYGATAYDNDRALREADLGSGLTGLTSLVFEEVARASVSYRYSILSQPSQLRLPAIKRIVWVDSCLGKTAFGIASKPPRVPHVRDEREVLRHLFEVYPTLESVQWIDKRPADPFADDYGEAFLDRHLIRRVERAEVFA